MPLDPRISLMGNPVNVQKTFADSLINVSNIEKINQAAIQNPLRHKLLQTQVDSAANKLTQDREKQRAQSMIDLSIQMKPFLDSGDDVGAINVLQSRADQLDRVGISSEDTRELMDMIATNPFQAMDSVNAGVELGRQKAGNNQGFTSKQRELAQFNALPENTEQERIFKKQFGQAIGAISKLQTIAQKLDLAGGKADIKTEQALDEAQKLEKLTEGGRQGVQLGKIKIDETQINNAEAKKQAIDSKNVRRAEADNATAIITALLDKDLFSSAFGRYNNAPPEGLRRQSNIDARAQVDQILGLLSLESRQKLKGQGTITDSEAKTLEKSATLLSNELISDELARKELRRVKRIFEDASDRNLLKAETVRGKDQGQIMVDAQGNRARVFKDGRIEEL